MTLLFSTLPFSSCAKDDDGKTTVKISEVTHSVFYAPLYLADALGYFGEENIEIDLTNGGGADNVMSAVLSGSADVGFCGPEAALYVLAGGRAESVRATYETRRLVPRFAQKRTGFQMDGFKRQRDPGGAERRRARDDV